MGSALVGRLAGSLIGVITFGVLARSIGAEGLGQYRTVLTMLLFAGVAFDFGLYSITLREMSQRSGRESLILGNVVALRVCATLLAVLLLFGLLSFTTYDHTIRYGVLVAGVGWIGYQLNDMLRAVFQEKLVKHKGALAEIIGASVSLALIIGLTVIDGDTDAMLAATAVGLLCTAGLAWHYAYHLVPFRMRFDWEVWRTVIIAGLPIAGSVILLNVQLRIDVLLLSVIQDPRHVGLYDAPVKLYELLFVIPYLFGGMMMPLFVRDLSGGSGSLIPRLGAAVGVSVVISSLAFGVMFVHAEDIVTLLAGPEFAESAKPLRILAGAALFAGISAILRFAATALQQPGRMLKVDVIGVTAAVVAHAILIPRYGIIGAAMGKLFGDVVTSVAAIVVLRGQFTPAMLGSGLLALIVAAVLIGSLDAANYVHLNWIVGTILCTGLVGSALTLVPHVRRGLRNLSHVGTQKEQLRTAS